MIRMSRYTLLVIVGAAAVVALLPGANAAVVACAGEGCRTCGEMHPRAASRNTAERLVIMSTARIVWYEQSARGASRDQGEVCACLLPHEWVRAVCDDLRSYVGRCDADDTSRQLPNFNLETVFFIDKYVVRIRSPQYTATSNHDDDTGMHTRHSVSDHVGWHAQPRSGPPSVRARGRAHRFGKKEGRWKGRAQPVESWGCRIRGPAREPHRHPMLRGGRQRPPAMASSTRRLCGDPVITAGAHCAHRPTHWLTHALRPFASRVRSARRRRSHARSESDGVRVWFFPLHEISSPALVLQRFLCVHRISILVSSRVRDYVYVSTCHVVF